jgi:hypothetical protein
MPRGVAAGAPPLRPVDRDVVELRLCDLLLEGVDEHVVRKNANAEQSLRHVSARHGFESCLETQRKKGDRNVVGQSLNRARRIGEHGEPPIGGGSSVARGGVRCFRAIGVLRCVAQLLVERLGGSATRGAGPRSSCLVGRISLQPFDSLDCLRELEPRGFLGLARGGVIALCSIEVSHYALS